MSGTLLEFNSIYKEYPGVKAVNGVSFSISKGAVTALLGANGAGKSTLMKILSGAETRDSGDIIIQDNYLPKNYSTLEAKSLGIGIIYQELSLLSELTVAENIYLTNEPLITQFPKIIDYKKMKKEAKHQLEKLQVYDVDVDEKVSNLSLPNQQMVEIAKALAQDCKVIIMDEPTTSLATDETKRLFDVIKHLKKQNISIIYISHRLDEIFEIADNAVIMRDGELVNKLDIDKTSKDEIITSMTGRKLNRVKTEDEISNSNEIMFGVRGISDRKFLKDISFSVRKNEILGIGGLVGAQRTELARLIFGADKLEKGEISLNGEIIQNKTPEDAIRNGIGYLSENRKEEALNLGLSVQENIIQTDLPKVSKGLVVSDKKIIETFKSYKQKMNIKGAGSTAVKNLSGGNQQKVAIAKWLHVGAKLLIFDEPTRGVDVGAKAEIYQLVRDFARKGNTAIVISSEIEELATVSDRVLIMAKGEITHELKGSDVNQDTIFNCITTKGSD
ncbi:sugar ABC transporter ATP-binding protein [Gracilibacillus sp. YIM 98692]|uniref:sugar ABC transporter ATP-binding protein n=1 Tax=Gracilibacillus sp. YIM 98692 TaxID=2663532 RepID=UPI001969DCFD|nr:sugar ABC transporter ATP-binding protein [Gracilibacillus sp. YIM 98692]